MKNIVLVLPQHPDESDLEFCTDQVDEIQSELEFTGISGGTPSPPENPNRILYEEIAPYVRNLAQVANKLNLRAYEAKRIYLNNPSAVKLDYIGLKTTIRQIAKLHANVQQYQELTDVIKYQSEALQRKHLALFVYSPLFRGSGFAVPGNPTSKWVEGISVWCQPMLLAIKLEKDIGWHIPMWQIRRNIEKGPKLGYIILGGVGLYAGVRILQKYLKKR